jgi:ryanodine receptor 2
MTTYTPKPKNLDDIVVPEALTPLAETIAEHVHDVWAEGRIKEGWTYGEKRDDDAKKHPCLLPYADLPDSEKEYDRNTAAGTVKLILAAGFVISQPCEEEAAACCDASA